MTITLGPRRLKIAISCLSSSFRPCFTRRMPSRIQLVIPPMAMSSAPIRLAFTDTATKSRPVRAPLAPPVISAKPAQSAGAVICGSGPRSFT